MATNRTVLEFVQDILAYMESDIVNDVDETEESEMVLTLLESTFYDIVDELDLPHEKVNFQLTPGTSSKPTHMTMPDGVTRVDEILYNKLDSAGGVLNYQRVDYMNPKDFMNLINSRASDDSTVDSITDDSNITFLIRNDANPSWWTTFDDEVIIFDSYDSDLESNLQASKTWVTAWKRPTWDNDKNAKPDLPQHVEQYFFNEAASVAYATFKQRVNEKLEQRAQRARRAARNSYSRMGPKIQIPNYGRRR